jgi:hypothetical protein
VDFEMLKKYRNLQFLDIIKKGINHRMGVDVFSQSRQHAVKAFMRDFPITESDIFSFACNCTTKAQTLSWNVTKGTFQSTEGACLNVHNILLDVSISIFIIQFAFFISIV